MKAGLPEPVGPPFLIEVPSQNEQKVRQTVDVFESGRVDRFLIGDLRHVSLGSTYHRTSMMQVSGGMGSAGKNKAVERLQGDEFHEGFPMRPSLTARTLPDALKDVLRLNVVQTGGPGGTTSVFIRGANSNRTKVFIDGIDATDPATGTFNFEHILTWDIDRVEVVRGPQSGLYGADAIGGVINIITKKESGPGQFTGSLEGGTFGTFNQNARVSAAAERYKFYFDFAHFHSS